MLVGVKRHLGFFFCFFWNIGFFFCFCFVCCLSNVNGHTTNNYLLLGGGVLGDGLGALRDGVLGKFSGEQKTDGGLDLAAGQGGLGVVLDQLAGLASNALKDVVDEGVHDGHGAFADASVGVDLLEHLVDVRGVGLDTLGLAFASFASGGFAFALGLALSGLALASGGGGSSGSGSGGGGLSGFGGGFLGSFRGHVVRVESF